MEGLVGLVHRFLCLPLRPLSPGFALVYVEVKKASRLALAFVLLQKKSIRAYQHEETGSLTATLPKAPNYQRQWPFYQNRGSKCHRVGHFGGAGNIQLETETVTHLEVYVRYMISS